VFVNVVDTGEAGGTELGNGIGTDIERSLSGTSSGRNTVHRGNGICLLLLLLLLVLRSNVQSSLLLHRDLGLKLLLLSHCLHHLHLEELRLIHLVHAHGELGLPEELLLLLLLKAGSTISEASSHGSAIGVEAVVVEGLATKIKTITGIFVNGRGVGGGHEAWDIE
jgi:hypothetical protein